MAAAGLTFVLALEARWVPAALCVVIAGALLWLGGVWVSPWSSDAYARRLTRAWEAWAPGAQWAYDGFAYRATRLRARIEALQPPRGYEQEHARLVGLLADRTEARTA